METDAMSQFEGSDDSLILDAVKTAVAAGSLRYWARQTPDAERGLLKAAGRYSEISMAALETWLSAVGEDALAALPSARRGDYPTVRLKADND